MDYTKYSDDELRESLESIDSAQYPENYKNLLNELKNRDLILNHEPGYKPELKYEEHGVERKHYTVKDLKHTIRYCIFMLAVMLIFEVVPLKNGELLTKAESPNIFLLVCGSFFATLIYDLYLYYENVHVKHKKDSDDINS